MGFVWFIAGFDDVSYDVKATEPEAVIRTLLDAQTIVERKMFAHAPIFREKIEALVSKEVHDVGALASHLKSVKQSELSKQFAPLVSLNIPPEAAHKMGDPVDLAWAYYVNRLFRQIAPPHTPAQVRTDKKEVRLATDYNGWVLVKKASLKAPDKEILAALVGMNQSLFEKVPELATPGFSDFSIKVEKALSVFPERKSFSRLPLILRALLSPELKTSDPSLEEYALAKALMRGGFSPFISTELFSSLYPELKIPKPRGNYGGKKKK